MTSEHDAHASEDEPGRAEGELRSAEGTLVRRLRQAITCFLFLLVVAAPHSIAATQFAWVCALLLWMVRLCLAPRPRVDRTPVDVPLLVFFVLTFLSALFSYDPDVSLPLLRGVSLFTIAYLFAQNIRTRRTLRLLALALVASCTVNVAYTFAERAAGRGVKVSGVAEGGVLHAAGVRDSDILLEVAGRKVGDPSEVVAALEASGEGPAPLRVYRQEQSFTFHVARGQLAGGATPVERLGVASWSRGRDWRAAGFYGHYVTYAEVLQLIASLALGLFVALGRKLSRRGLLLLLALTGFGAALVMTVTRAPWLGFLLSALVIATVGLSRRVVVVLAACALPLVVAGLFVLQRQRNVGFYDRGDPSVTWRETVWREGWDLLVSRPRHLLVGVGMNSIKRHWREWNMFDGGRIPIGHMHSTPLQLALERGVPALLAWLALMYVYGRMLFRLARSRLEGWVERGVALGALGGLVGFLASGVVHYNWGDSEVVMVVYTLMGFSLFLERGVRFRGDGRDSVSTGVEGI